MASSRLNELQSSLQAYVEERYPLRFSGSRLSPLDPDLGVFGDGKNGQTFQSLDTQRLGSFDGFSEEEVTADQIMAYQVAVVSRDPDAARDEANEILLWMARAVRLWSLDQCGVANITNRRGILNPVASPRSSHQKDAARLVEIYLSFELVFRQT